MPTKLKKVAAATAPVAPEVKAVVKAKRVERIAPPADVKATAKPAATAKAAKVKTPKATRNISKDQFLGRNMRISEFQDYTLSINAGPKARLTDEELCALWQAQFPNAVKFTPFHVRGVRRDYNVGRHSKAFAGRKTGDAISVAYMVKDGKRVPAVITAQTKADKATAA